MAEPFKLLIHAGTVQHTAAHLQRHLPGFDAPRFTAQALAGLDALELKARAMQLADALQASLPGDFDTAADGMERVLAPPVPPETPAGAQADAAGLRGWVVWSLGEWVARTVARDARHLPRALDCLHALTQRFSAEFAIRPLLRDYPDVVLATLHRWTTDPSAHVRRLVSEGSRPRLPWGPRLQSLVQDPRPTLPLLRALQDDPSPYVRRSVANHLNDIAKDHPAVVTDWLAAWLPGASTERRALLRHASRTLVKQGHAPTLALWGQGAALAGQATLTVSPARARLGDRLTLRAQLAPAAGAAPQPLVVDYVLHYCRAGGRHSAKVFKGWTLELPPGAPRVLERQHTLKPVTTRRHHPGLHRVELQVNGQVVAQDAFELLDGDA